MTQLIKTKEIPTTKHPKCKGYYHPWNGEFDCDYDTKLLCEECKYGLGRKDPAAKCNQRLSLLKD